MTLPQFILPPSLNYIGAFLTFDCNLNCSYCINDPEQRGDRKGVFMMKDVTYCNELTPYQWATALNRIPAKEDLPITFQGGEPTMYWKGEGLGLILENTENYADLLTNFAVPPELFAKRLRGQQGKLRRTSPYPPIRVSFHQQEMDKTWGNGLEELVKRCEGLSDHGFSVSPDPSVSDVGIYMVDHPENRITDELKALTTGRVPFFEKDFLGVYKDQLHGEYRYPFSTDLIARNVYPKTLNCECRTTELLIDPLGFVWGCHYYLYRAWETNAPKRWFRELQRMEFDFAIAMEGVSGDILPIGHMLDPKFSIQEIEVFRPCSHYGRCIGCDTKFKSDRHANENVFRSSVIIKNIQWPEGLRDIVSNDHKRKA